MLDKPIYKDWIFYLWILSIVAVVPGTLLSSYNGGGPGSFALGILGQTIIFLILPSGIRMMLRIRRSSGSNKFSQNYLVDAKREISKNSKSDYSKKNHQIQIKSMTKT